MIMTMLAAAASWLLRMLLPPDAHPSHSIAAACALKLFYSVLYLFGV